MPLITVLLIYYSLAGLGLTVRRTLVHLLFRRLPCHPSAHRGRRGARCSLFCLPVVDSSSLPPHRCVLPSTACSLVRPFVSSRIPPQTPVVASVSSYLFLLSSVTSVSLSLLSSSLCLVSSRLVSRLFSVPGLLSGLLPHCRYSARTALARYQLYQLQRTQGPSYYLLLLTVVHIHPTPRSTFHDT